MHRRPRLRSTSTAEHRQTTGRARSRRGHRGGCAPRGLQSTSPDLWRAEGTSTSTPAAAAWRPHSLIGGECGRQAALHGYTAPVPSARRSRTDRDPVRESTSRYAFVPSTARIDRLRPKRGAQRGWPHAAGAEERRRGRHFYEQLGKRKPESRKAGKFRLSTRLPSTKTHTYTYVQVR